MRLAGKVAVVTGGGSGIGRGIVLALAREGADIVIPDIQVLNAEKVAGEVKGLGRKVIAMKTDVTSAADVKTKSVFLTCKAITPNYIERKAGRIVNIASIAGPISAPTMPPYSVDKMGVITLTRIIAKELAPHGVTVNAICPCVLWTDFWQKLAAHLAETNPVFKGMTARQVFDKRVADITPMKREQTPEDIGWAAVFLASDEARNITGQSLNVDGGVVMQ